MMLRNFRQVFKSNQMPMGVIMMVVLVGMVAYLAPSHGGSEAPDNVVARVYGRDIQKRDVDVAIGEMLKRMGKQPNLDAMMPYLRAQALRQLINQRLQEELAERHGIVVTDEEVESHLEALLRHQPVFLGPDNQLRPTEEINQILRENGHTLKEWEDDVRKSLVVQKLLDQAASLVPADEAWLNMENRVKNEKFSFEAVALAPEPETVADPGDAKLAAFMQAGGARFQVGPRRVIQYVALDQTFFGDAVKVDDGALKSAYETKKAQYQELKAKHILFKARTDDEVHEAMQKAEALRAKLVAGADFAKAADDNTEDPSGKGKGGDLGWFKSGVMPKPFEDAAKALKPGEISQPVRTDLGIDLIKLEERREKPFEDVKEELRAQITRERFASKAKDRLEQLRKRTGERGDLAAAARSLGLKLQTSQPFLAEADTLEGIPMGAMMVPEAFRLHVGDISKIQRLGDRFAVFKVQEERPTGIPPLKDIRAQVLQAYRLEEARRALLAKAKGLLASGGLNALGTPVPQNDSTLASLGDLGQHSAIRKALLETPEGKLTPPLWNSEGKLWVARITGRTTPEPMDFAKRRTLLEGLRSASSRRTLEAELQDLSAKGRLHPGFSSLWGRFSGIWINPDSERQTKEDLVLPDED